MVRQAYRDQKNLATLIDRDVRRHVGKRPDQWFFAGRVKGEESFLQKIRSGRVRDFRHLEDFYACEIVVPLSSDIPAALKFVEPFFEEVYRKPISEKVTGKPAHSFVFDDLRVYGTLRSDPSLPSRPVDTVVFEIQVKTFLQHAWAIATHDLVYKYDRASWARSRVAYQVKALLEQAELSINGITDLEASEFLPHDGEPESSIQRLIDFLALEFEPALLPQDRRRMATTILDVAGWFGYIEFDSITKLFAYGRRHYNGHPLGWDPYDCLTDYASLKSPARVRKALTLPGVGRTIFVSSEVAARLGVPRDRLVNAVV